jgi:hypothetical protein
MGFAIDGVVFASFVACSNSLNCTMANTSLVFRINHNIKNNAVSADPLDISTAKIFLRIPPRIFRGFFRWCTAADAGALATEQKVKMMPIMMTVSPL